MTTARCKFGRPHAWFRRPDVDIDDCMTCGAVSDDRDPVVVARHLFGEGLSTESVEAHIQRTYDCSWREAQNTVEAAL